MSKDSERSGGLQRKTPLRSTKPMKKGKGLSPGKGLARSKGLSSGVGRLSQGSGLERKTPLANKTPLASSKGLSAQRTSSEGTASSRPGRGGPREHRAKPMNRTAMKYSPPPTSPEERRCREVVALRSHGICERCGRAGGLEKAHRVARSQQGKWDPCNILDLCSACHGANHAHPAEAYDAGQHLRSGQDPLSSPALIWKGGRYDWALLDNDGGWRWVEGE